jgi:ABC-type glycerol-3-phosphate transport system permease component
MLTHVILVLGVLLFALPIWIVLMGSTHDAGTIGRGGRRGSCELQRGLEPGQ